MSANALNSIHTFEAWAKDYYEPLAIRHYDRAIARMLSLLRPPPNADVLDAGCGTGVHSIRVAKAGFRVRAIDVSTVALSEARQRADAAGLADQIRFEHADLACLPFENAEFDAIFSWGVVIHIHDMEPALRELVRVLRPGGRLALQITNGAALDHIIESFGRRLIGKPKPGWEQTSFGLGSWDESTVGRLWTVRADVPAIIRSLEQCDCRRTHRSASEFTELQRHTRGLPRTALRLLNDFWSTLRLPAQPACTNLIVFEKAKP